MHCIHWCLTIIINKNIFSDISKAFNKLSPHLCVRSEHRREDKEQFFIIIFLCFLWMWSMQTTLYGISFDFRFKSCSYSPLWHPLLEWSRFSMAFSCSGHSFVKIRRYEHHSIDPKLSLRAAEDSNEVITGGILKGWSPPPHWEGCSARSSLCTGTVRISPRS